MHNSFYGAALITGGTGNAFLWVNSFRLTVGNCENAFRADLDTQPAAGTEFPVYSNFGEQGSFID